MRGSSSIGRRTGAAAAALAVCGALAACGSGGARQDAAEPSGNYQVAVSASRFPSSQTLSQHVHLVISVRNTGQKTIPNVAVSVCPVTCGFTTKAGAGTSSAVFDSNLGPNSLDNPSRPVWIVDRPPGPCSGRSGYSCRSGGGGGYATQYPDTWASGALRPGATVHFVWAVTAVSTGRHVVAWQVAAGLNGKAKAVLADGSIPQGRYLVNVSSATQQTYVNNAGQIVAAP